MRARTTGLICVSLDTAPCRGFSHAPDRHGPGPARYHRRTHPAAATSDPRRRAHPLPGRARDVIAKMGSCASTGESPATQQGDLKTTVLASHLTTDLSPTRVEADRPDGRCRVRRHAGARVQRRARLCARPLTTLEGEHGTVHPHPGEGRGSFNLETHCS